MRVQRFAAVLLSLFLVRAAFGSWLSDITGVNIDIPAGKVTIGAPNPAAIGPMLQNLPKDVGVALLGNVAGNALAFEIRRGEKFHSNGASIPPHIKQALAPYFEKHILEGVRWVEFDPGVFTIGNTIIKQSLLEVGAVTMNRVIVFQRKSDGQTNCSLWAHELTHVVQYDQMGIEAFAAIYATGVGAKNLEDQAYSYQGEVMKRIGFCPPVPTTPSPYVPPKKFYYTYKTGYKPGKAYHLGYVKHFQPVIRKKYPAGGCASHVGSAQDFDVTLRNDCPIPITITNWVQEREKKKETVQIRVKCTGNCTIAASSQKTFTTPSKKPVVDIEYRY